MTLDFCMVLLGLSLGHEREETEGQKGREEEEKERKEKKGQEAMTLC